jgi:carboxyl-terminal processing protease
MPIRFARRVRPLAALIAAVLVSACATTAQTQSTPSAAAAMDPALALATFDSAWSRIHNSYYDSTFKGTSWTAVRDELRPRVQGARTEEEVRNVIREMLGRIGDSHFALIPREAYDAVDQVDDGDDGDEADEADEIDDVEEDDGIDDVEEGDDGGVPADAGVDLRLVEGAVTVTRVEEGGAAEAAGVRPGWVLEAVDDREVQPWLDALGALEGEAAQVAGRLGVLGRAGALLQGEEGETVLVRFRDGDDTAVERELTLRPVAGEAVRFGNLPTMYLQVQSSRVQQDGGCVGVVRLTLWMAAMRSAWERAMDDFAGCRGMVIDLRGNPGGVGGLVMGASGAFLDRSVALGVMKTRQNELRFVSIPRRVTHDARATQPFAGPVAILVDEMSMSTSEIFAAGMQGVGRARVFGERTPGMALPALMLRLPNQDVLYHAIANFLGPDGERIEGRGAVPDERVPLTRADLLAGRDRPLQAALDWIRGASAPR